MTVLRLELVNAKKLLCKFEKSVLDVTFVVKVVANFVAKKNRTRF